MKSDADRRLERPAEPRSREREGRRRGIRDPFRWRQMRCEAAARAVPEGIAGGQHCGRMAAAGKDARYIERHRPRLAATVDARKLQVTLTTEHGLGPVKRVSACFR